MMKPFINSISFIFLAILTTSCAKEMPKTFSISGSISPAKADYIILQKETDIERKITKVIDTIKVDAQGNFNGSYSSEPYLYSLNFPNKKKVDIALNKGQELLVNITGYDSDNFKTITQGSKDTNELLAYENFRVTSLDKLVKSVRREITALKKAKNPDQEKIVTLGQLEVDNYTKHLDELVDYIQQNMSSTLGLYATSIRWKGAHQLAKFDALATKFEAVHSQLAITKKIREKVTRLQQTAIGGTVANIKMPNVTGNIVDLSSIKSAYILIDFWASWCGPCRRESAGLNELFSTYARDDFDIYGVSLDDKKELWLAALEKDNRTWTNVSTLERFKTPAAFDYAVTALPDNYLIDSNGKILAKNIHGEELTTLIKKLLVKN